MSRFDQKVVKNVEGLAEVYRISIYFEGYNNSCIDSNSDSCQMKVFT